MLANRNRYADRGDEKFSIFCKYVKYKIFIIFRADTQLIKNDDKAASALVGRADRTYFLKIVLVTITTHSIKISRSSSAD